MIKCIEGFGLLPFFTFLYTHEVTIYIPYLMCILFFSQLEQSLYHQVRTTSESRME